MFYNNLNQNNYQNFNSTLNNQFENYLYNNNNLNNMLFSNNSILNQNSNNQLLNNFNFNNNQILSSVLMNNNNNKFYNPNQFQFTQENNNFKIDNKISNFLPVVNKNTNINRNEINFITKDKRKLQDEPEEKNKININLNENKNNKNQILEKIENEKKIILQDKSFWKKIENVNNFILNPDIAEKNNSYNLNPKDFNLGNFEHFYYNKFISSFNDERLTYFEDDLLKNKKCLDIGCNNGILTILLALNFQPSFIEGIDIDSKLIKKAIKNYKYVLRNNLNKDYIDNLIITDKKNNQNENILEEILNRKEEKNNHNKYEIGKKSINEKNISENSNNYSSINKEKNTENVTKLYNDPTQTYNDEIAKAIKVKLFYIFIVG